MALTILSIGLLVFAGHFLSGFFARTKVPDVLILMLAGIILGPVLHIVSPEDFGRVGPVFTTLALIIILFEGGIHLNVRDLGVAARDTLAITLATFAITVLLISYLADFLLPVGPLEALLIGTILGGTSTAVVVPLIRVLHPAPLPTTILLLESALTDVLTVVLSLGLLRALTPGEVVTAGSLIGGIARAFLFAALVGAAGAFIWSAILPKVRQFPNTVFTTVAYVLILYGVTELWGYSGAIAALMFGIAVANLPNIPERVQGRVISFRLVGFAEVERTFFSEAVFLVKTFFFVYLGISIGLSDWTTVTIGFLLAAIAFVGRAVIIRFLASKETSRRDVMLMTALIPKGLAAAVLAGLPAQQGIPGGEVIQGTVYAVILFSIVLCAVFVFVIEGGRLDGMAAWYFKPFATEPPAQSPETARPDVASIEASWGLPPRSEAWDEPNPVTLDDAPGPDAPREDG